MPNLVRPRDVLPGVGQCAVDQHSVTAALPYGDEPRRIDIRPFDRPVYIQFSAARHGQHERVIRQHAEIQARLLPANEIDAEVSGA